MLNAYPPPVFLCVAERHLKFATNGVERQFVFAAAAARCAIVVRRLVAAPLVRLVRVPAILSALAAPPPRRVVAGVGTEGGCRCLAGCAVRKSVVAVGSSRSDLAGAREVRREGYGFSGEYTSLLLVSRRNNLRPFAKKTV